MNIVGKRVAYITLGCKLNFSETSTIKHSLELRRNARKIDRTHHQNSICCIERRRDAREIIGVDAGEVFFAAIATDAPMHRDASA